jgi:REP element-mobilizing transposase RayT
MPRKTRVDAPGAFHHIICRAIERRKIFYDNADRDNFLERLENILIETSTPCYGWALLPNHFHLLLRTGNASISTVMQRLLTGYAVSFNRRHRRRGHLFQNRFKSILCQENMYLKQLVRYIHLNPLRAKAVIQLSDLIKYPYSGHSAIMGGVKRDFQLEIFKPGNQPLRVRAKSLVCFWAVRELRMSGTKVGKFLKLTQSAVSRAVRRGEKLVEEMNLTLVE